MSLGNFAKGVYKVKHPEKYTGIKMPLCRSSWETTFCSMCDSNPNILEWASEPIKIPYRDPLTNKQTVYVPDFLIKYVDASKKEHIELIEIKPAKQALRERVGKDAYNQAQYVKNMAKWKAAAIWCEQRNIKFRVITEDDIFHNPSKKR